MEESKAAAYYDELTRKGEGAARFKQGLGFTSRSSDTDSAVPIKGSALSSSTSSFLSNFVKSSTPNTTSELQHQSELHSIKNKLKKKTPSSDRDRDQPRVSDRDREKRPRRRSRSRSRSRDRSSRHRCRSTSRDGERRRRRRRNRSRSDSEEELERRRDRERSRSLSPMRKGRSERIREGGDRDKGEGKGGKERKAKVDYSRLIEGYDKMSPAERVKAKMKLQLTETVEKDATKGMGSGWERFEFNKDAPLDDEEIEAAEDDAKLVKHIGQSFRFSAVEARKEEEIKAAHDKAMFGVPATRISITTDHKLEEENNKTESNKSDVTSLVSEKVLAKQQGSWRDRVRKV